MYAKAIGRREDNRDLPDDTGNAVVDVDVAQRGCGEPGVEKILDELIANYRDLAGVKCSVMSTGKAKSKMEKVTYRFRTFISSCVNCASSPDFSPRADRLSCFRDWTLRLS